MFNYFAASEQNAVMSNAVNFLCVRFCLHTILIKARIWLRGSIPVLSPLIRQEGCQLWALCCRLNSQTAPLNWTLELSMCTECLPCPALEFTFHRGGMGGARNKSCRHTTSCLYLEGYSEMCRWFIISRQCQGPWEECGILQEKRR